MAFGKTAVVIARLENQVGGRGNHHQSVFFAFQNRLAGFVGKKFSRAAYGGGRRG